MIGSARERTRLAADRTTLAAAALAVVLVRIGVDSGRALDVAAGVLAAALAALLCVRPIGAPRPVRVVAVAVTATLVAALVTVEVVGDVS